MNRPPRIAKILGMMRAQWGLGGEARELEAYLSDLEARTAVAASGDCNHVWPSKGAAVCVKCGAVG